MSKKTQREVILNHLKMRKPLTSEAGWFNYGISNLPARIGELIREGHKIKKLWVTVKNRYGEDVRVRQYRYG